MLKYFLKNSGQEVKVGDRILITVPGKTPYGDGKCEVTVLVTQASLAQLIKDGIIEPKGVVGTPDRELYRPYIRRLAKRLDVRFDEALDFLDVLLDHAPYAHNCLLVDLIAELSNKDKKFGPTVYVIDMATNKPLARTSSDGSPFNCPVFADFTDAKKACSMLAPFVEMMRYVRK